MNRNCKSLLGWPDVLNAPMSAAEISARVAALDAYLQPRTRIMLGCMGITVLGTVAAVVVCFLEGLNSAASGYLMLAATLTMATGVLLSVITAGGEAMKVSLLPLPPENIAEMGWLLENVPQAEMLKAAVAKEPRCYVHGELRALQAAYAENQASARRTATSE